MKILLQIVFAIILAGPAFAQQTIDPRLLPASIPRGISIDGVAVPAGANLSNWQLNFQDTGEINVTNPSTQNIQYSIVAGSIVDSKIAASGITTRSKLPGAIGYEDEANTWTLTNLYNGAVTIGGTGSFAIQGSTSGTITLGRQAAAGTYNFNLPTSAGTAGLPLLSGGGGATPMSFSILGLGGGGTGSSGPWTPLKCIHVNAAGTGLEITGADCGTGTGGQPLDADLTAIAAFTGTGFLTRIGTDSWAQRQMTGQPGNIVITNPLGIAGDVLIDLGATAVQTDQSNTWTTGDQSMAAAASFTFPSATGAAPTADGRCAQDTTAHRLKCGFNGATVTLATVAETQPLNTVLTQLSGVTSVTNAAFIFKGGVWTTLTRPSCSGAGQAINYDATLGTEGCVTFGSFLGSMTPGRLQQALTETTIGDSIISELTGVATVNGNLVVGATGPYLTFNNQITASDKSWTVQNIGGTIIPCAAAGTFTNGHVIIASVSAGLVTCADGGLAGTGDQTATSVATFQNKTIDESNNTLKITKSVQVELYPPGTNNATGAGLFYYRVPVSLNGTNLVGIQANVIVPGTTGTVAVQIVKCTATATLGPCTGTTVNMLSTVSSIDSGENSTTTAAAAAAISGTAGVATVSTGQILRFDVTAVHTTPAKGLIVNLDFKLP